MSSSDSDAPIPTRKRVPTDTAITSALRAAVQACYTNDDEENLTHKRIRATVARNLKLADDFFKTSDKWNAKSKQIVLDEIAKHTNAQDEDVKEPSPEPVPVKHKPEPQARSKPKPKRTSKRPTKKAASDDEEEDNEGVEDVEDVDDDAEEAPSSPKLKKPVRKSAPQKGQTRPTKRKSDEAITQTSRKRQKQVVTSDEEAASEDAEEEEEEEEGKASEDEYQKNEDIEEAEDVEELQDDNENDEEEQPQPQRNLSENKAPEQDSDSEMSIVFDEPPAKKGGRKTSTTSKKPPSNAPTTKAKSTKPESTLTPQEEEIKRLQSWLVKCGLRKVWSKELSNCDTPKEKIAHLKRLLKDVGMEGRFSEDKAKKIKEEREFKKDLEEIKEGNAKWGESEGSGEEDESGGRPRRKLARGLRELAAFDDEEESD